MSLGKSTILKMLVSLIVGIENLFSTGFVTQDTSCKLKHKNEWQFHHIQTSSSIARLCVHSSHIGGNSESDNFALYHILIFFFFELRFIIFIIPCKNDGAQQSTFHKAFSVSSVFKCEKTAPLCIKVMC